MATITQFCVDDDGYIIQDTVPRDEDGNVATPIHMNPISYDYDLIEIMERPKYDFNNQVFIDDPVDMNYYITQMNLAVSPEDKEMYRKLAYFRILLCAFYFLWGCENQIINKNNVLNDITNNIFGENCLIYIKSDDYLYKKSLIYPYEETQLTTKKVVGTASYVGNNEIVFKDDSQVHLYKKSILDQDNDEEVFDEVVNETVLTYIGKDKIIFLRDSDTYLYTLNLNTSAITVIDITVFNINWVYYVGNNEFVYRKNTNNYLYLYDLDIHTESLLFSDFFVKYITYVDNDNREIIFIKDDTDKFLYKLNLNTLVLTQLTTYNCTSVCYIGNDKIMFTKESDNYIYQKSINEQDNETLFFDEEASYLLFCGDIFINQEFYNEYYNKTKPEILNFLLELVKIELGTPSELNTYYFNTQTLRENYGIYANENIKDIPGFKENDKLWIEQMNQILGKVKR